MNTPSRWQSPGDFRATPQALKHQLCVGSGRAESVAIPDRAADDLARQQGDVLQQGLGMYATGIGVALGKAHQGAIEFVQLRVQRLGDIERQGRHHAIGLDFQQAPDHASLAISVEPSIDEQQAIGAVLGQAKIAPDHRIAAAHTSRKGP